MKDKYSEERLALLHPKAQPIFRAFIDECEQVFNVILRITLGLRTIAQQNALYAQGRTLPGPIVTDAPGGKSYHNYGFAIDLCEMDEATDSEIDWSYDMGKLQPIATKYNIEWGGSWVHLKDRPHFELRFGFQENCSDLLALINSGKVDEKGYVIF